MTAANGATTGVQYRCGTRHEQRITELRGPANTGPINFIEYLEVLDHDAPGERQTTLLVHTFFDVPDALTADNVRIDGGVRVRPARVSWAYPAKKIPPGTLPPAEQAVYEALPDAGRVVVVRTAEPGDFSTYTLLLVTSVDHPDATSPDAPPPGFDPILSRVDFSFKVECGTPFDCREDAGCAPSVPASPRIDYLAKDYASFRRLMLDRLAAVVPGWTERHAADLGVALVEVMAYAADHLSYYQDAVATEAYLGTARKRESVRRHAILLDYPMHEGCNARTWIAVRVSGDDVLLPRVEPVSGLRTRFFTQVPNEPAVVGEERFRQLSREGRVHVFEPMEDAVLQESHNAISFYTWLESGCCLPRGATRATLHEPKTTRLKLRPGDVLVLDVVDDLAIDGDTEVLVPVSSPTRRHAVRLTRVRPEATQNVDGTRTPAPTPLLDPLTGERIVEIEWQSADALPWPLCLSGERSLESAGSPVPDLVVARGNVILADHGETMPDEPLAPSLVPRPRPPGDVPPPRYRPRLASGPVTQRVPFDPLADTLPPASGSLVQDPHAAAPDVMLATASDVWRAQRHLLRSDASAREFVVEVGNDGGATLRFGDGIFGHEPEDGLIARYRVGNGLDGNVGAGAIGHVVSTQASAILDVTNPLPATGAADQEPIEDVRLFAPQAFRVQERAVTEADWAEVAQRHPDVLKAVATRRWTGSFYTVYVTVERRGGPPDDPAGFLDEMRRFLDRYRMAGMDLDVDLPRLVPLDVLLGICVEDGYLRSDVRRALFERMGAFFQPDRFTFGQPVYLSQVIAAAMQAPGVAWVDVDPPADPSAPRPRFQRLTDGVDATPGNVERGQIAIGRLEIAQLTNSPSLPEQGTLDFSLRGGL